MRLQELIATRKQELGITYTEMVRRAAVAGYPVGRTMLHHFAVEEWDNVPTTDSIRGIAAALELDPDVILAAAAESVGINLREIDLGHGARALLALLAGRSDQEVAALEAVLRSTIKAMDVAPRATADTPCGPPSPPTTR